MREQTIQFKAISAAPVAHNFIVQSFRCKREGLAGKNIKIFVGDVQNAIALYLGQKAYAQINIRIA